MRVNDSSFPTRCELSKRSDRKIWLETLPELLEKVVALWSLRLGTPIENGGTCSWVCPVVRFDGTHAVLKLAMPHMEGKQEIQGLKYWSGRSMVKLIEADEDSGAMLLERCQPGTTLRSEPEPVQDGIIAGVLRRIWESTTATPGLADFRHLSQMIDFWCEETIAQRHLWPDAGLVKEGLRVTKELARPAPTDVLLATDLHADNVLRAQRSLGWQLTQSPS